MFVSGPAASFCDSLLPKGQWSIDEYDRIAFVCPARLQKQRSVKNHGLRIVCMVLNLLPDFGSDCRVHDFIELCSLRLMPRRFPEDFGGQYAPINLPGSIKHTRSEHRNDRVENCVHRQQFVPDAIRINNEQIQSIHMPNDRTLAGANAADNSCDRDVCQPGTRFMNG